MGPVWISCRERGLDVNKLPKEVKCLVAIKLRRTSVFGHFGAQNPTFVIYKGGTEAREIHRPKYAWMTE